MDFPHHLLRAPRYLEEDLVVISSITRTVVCGSGEASRDPALQRSLHAAAVWNNHLLLFGGYDGIHRINDLHAFFDTDGGRCWQWGKIARAREIGT